MAPGVAAAVAHAHALSVVCGVSGVFLRNKYTLTRTHTHTPTLHKTHKCLKKNQCTEAAARVAADASIARRARSMPWSSSSSAGMRATGAAAASD